MVFSSSPLLQLRPVAAGATALICPEQIHVPKKCLAFFPALRRTDGLPAQGEFGRTGAAAHTICSSGLID